jgi:hypothetical protein
MRVDVRFAGGDLLRAERTGHRAKPITLGLASVLRLALALALLPFSPAVAAAEQPLKVEADVAKGFHWPYYLAIPPSVAGSAVLLVEPNNPRILTNEDYELAAQEEQAMNRAWNFGFDVFAQLGSPVLVPFFPRRYPDRLGDDLFWTTHLDAGMFVIEEEEYRRLDLQLIAMIEDARARLSTMGIEVGGKVFMDGFSGSGEFVNRFTLLHPELVRAAAMGGAVLMVPVAAWMGEELPYPVGVADMEELAGQAFDLACFKRVPLYLYLGDEDTTDAVAYVFNPADKEQINRLFGDTPAGRFSAFEEVYTSVGSDSRFVVYPGVAHELTEETIAEVNAFFREYLVGPNIKAGGGDEPLSTTTDTPVSITISLDAGANVGQTADWWVAAGTPFGSYSYVHGQGWVSGIQPAAQLPLLTFSASFEVLDTALPAGDYTFYFAVDDNADGLPDATWVDSVEVRVRRQVFRRAGLRTGRK